MVTVRITSLKTVGVMTRRAFAHVTPRALEIADPKYKQPRNGHIKYFIQLLYSHSDIDNRNRTNAGRRVSYLNQGGRARLIITIFHCDDLMIDRLELDPPASSQVVPTFLEVT